MSQSGVLKNELVVDLEINSNYSFRIAYLFQDSSDVSQQTLFSDPLYINSNTNKFVLMILFNLSLKFIHLSN